MQRTHSQPPELPGFSYVSLLGSGGFADVFLYEQRMPRQKVAVKVLVADALSATTRAAFVAEANAMARLGDHPFIVKILGADIAADGRPYLIMEYLPGPSFAERHRMAPFSVPEALRDGVRLSSAIATAHAANILHRDIKPANVLTTSLGWPKLADFGIASTLETEVQQATTTAFAGDAVGEGTSESFGMSIPWSPPEVFEDSVEPDVRSDVFSLAATVYTILTGHSPFVVPGRSNSNLDLMARIERGTITPITRDDVPPDLVAVLKKGMAFAPAERYASAVDFARALQSIEARLLFTPTELAVENLGIAAPLPSLEPEGEDRTTARSIATVIAQPAPIGAPPPADDSTIRSAPVVAQPTALPGYQTDVTLVVPRVPVVGAQQQTAQPVPVQAAPAPPLGRGAIIALAVSGAVVLIVAVAVVLSVFVFGPPAEPTAENTKPSGGLSDGGAVPDVLAPPTLVDAVASADGTAVTFTWQSDEPQEGDSYLWTRSFVPDAQPVLTDEGTAVVEGVTPGEQVCISVVLVRSGVQSLPLEECLGS